uniref:Uncharacterized protein n=1 Tax=Kalanchoe fedtschenkoi TaxID=63787 RepID=A0A7N0ZVX0_KALFE
MILEMEEIKKEIWDLNGTSAPRLDGFTSVFYQACWDIIEVDLKNTADAYF